MTRFKYLPTAQRQFIFSVGVLLLAAGVRLWLIARMPTGLFTDESFVLLHAQEIARGQSFPVFMTGNQGVEPLVVYLAAVTVTILGPVNWAGRLVAAWLGLLSVAASLRLGKELFPGRFVGGLAALSLATLLWSLTLSRFGAQPIVAATASACAFAAFWHGVRTQSWRAYALAGLCVGLGLDGYVAFRFFPFVVLLAGLVLRASRRQAWRQLVIGGAITAGVAALVFAPLAVFFVQHPEWFLYRFQRTTSATLSAGSWMGTLTDNLVKAVGGFFVHGDENWRHNLAGRPALDAAQSLFFLVGLAAALRRWRSPESWALVGWLAIGIVPSILTVDLPHFGRATLAMPATALLVGLGIDTTWRLARSRVARGLIVTAVVLSGVLAVRDFFGTWATAPQLFDAFSGDQVSLARKLNATASPSATLYSIPFSLANAGDWYVYWSFEYLLDQKKFSRQFTLQPGECRLFPPPSADGAYLFFDDRIDSAGLRAIFPTVRPLGRLPFLEVDYLPAGQEAQWPVDHLRTVQFGDVVKMLGYATGPVDKWPGQNLELTAVWQAVQPTPSTYKLFVHLTGAPNAGGTTIYAQLDPQPCAGLFPTWQWKPGDTIMETYSLPLPRDMPPGSYALNVGWYEVGTGARLPAADEAGQPLGDEVLLDQTHILESNPSSPIGNN